MIMMASSSTSTTSSSVRRARLIILTMIVSSLFRAVPLCARAAGGRESNTRRWKPRNQFWAHILEGRAGLVDDGDGEQFDNMELCLESTLKLLGDDLVHNDTPPVVVDTLADSMNHTILVEVANAISPAQAQAIKNLAECTRRYFPNTRFQHRDFGAQGGGNDCTFVNILLQLFLPQVYENVVHITELAYEEARWGKQLNLQPPSTCGLHSSEYLDYRDFKGLGGHEDAGSIYTTLFALSDSKGYQGGEFYIAPGNETGNRKYYFKPRQYSAIVFISETHHGVTDIEAGLRETWANEFWMYDDPPWPATRGRPYNRPMGIFSKKCLEELDRVDYYHRREDMERLWHESR